MRLPVISIVLGLQFAIVGAYAVPSSGVGPSCLATGTDGAAPGSPDKCLGQTSQALDPRIQVVGCRETCCC